MRGRLRAGARTRRLAPKRRGLAAGVEATVDLRLGRRARRFVLRALGEDRRVTACLRPACVDAAGNAGLATKQVRLRR